MLVVEPSDIFREFLDVIVDHAGYDVVTVAAGVTAQHQLEHQRFDMVILASAKLGRGPDPLELARRAADAGAAVMFVLDDWSQCSAFADSGYVILTKPFMPSALIAEIERLRRQHVIDCEPRQAAQ
ncbi:MAG TPA: hypothetical protein VF502_10990 [Stellaceae bacterium]